MRTLLAPAHEAEWMIRLTIQLFTLSEGAFEQRFDWEQFKALQKHLVDILRESRDAQIALSQFIEAQARDVEDGAVVAVLDGELHVYKDVEPTLNRLFKDFFIKARTALYFLYSQQGDTRDKSVTHFLLEKQSISFVHIESDDKFEKHAAKFLTALRGDKAQNLVNLLRGDRATWSSTLIKLRDKMVHEITCDRLKVNYILVDGKPRAVFPTVSHHELRQYLNLFWENLYQAVEETVVLCIAIRMPDTIVPYRISDDAVNPTLPVRWFLADRIAGPNDLPRLTHDDR